MAYDSKQDTLTHIARVQELMADICERLALRAELHDASKLAEPENPLSIRIRPSATAVFMAAKITTAT